MEQNKIIIKRILQVGCIIFVIFLGFFLFGWLSKGSITVTTSGEDNFVSIDRVEGQKIDPETHLQAKQSLRVRLKPGTYTVSAFNRSVSSSKTIHLKARESVSIDLPLRKLTDAESVFSRGSSGLAADSSQIIFVDTASLFLEKINTNNEISVLDAAHPLLSARWVNPSLGVASGPEGNLYAVKAGVLQQLSTPFQFVSESTSSYDITKSGVIYASSEGSVYKGSVDGGFQNIYKENAAGLQVVASDTSLAIINSGSADDEGVQTGSSKGGITVISPTGAVKAKRTGLKTFGGAWSPDGSHLAVRSDTGVILFDQNLGNRKDIPVQGIGDLVWLNDKVLVYSDADVLWQYDIGADYSQQVSEKVGGTITKIYLDTSKSSVFAAVDGEKADGSSTSLLVRIRLSGNSNQSSTSAMGLFLPEKAGVCTLDYVNFTAAAFILYYPPGADPGSCMYPARSYLFDYGISVRENDFRTLPAPQAID